MLGPPRWVGEVIGSLQSGRANPLGDHLKDHPWDTGLSLGSWTRWHSGLWAWQVGPEVWGRRVGVPWPGLDRWSICPGGAACGDTHPARPAPARSPRTSCSWTAFSLLRDSMKLSMAPLLGCGTASRPYCCSVSSLWGRKWGGEHVGMGRACGPPHTTPTGSCPHRGPSGLVHIVPLSACVLWGAWCGQEAWGLSTQSPLPHPGLSAKQAPSPHTPMAVDWPQAQEDGPQAGSCGWA